MDRLKWALDLEMHLSAVRLRPTGARSECDHEERNDNA